MIISTSKTFANIISNMLEKEIGEIAVIDLDHLPEKFEVPTGIVMILVGKFPLADYKRYGEITSVFPSFKFVPLCRSKREMKKLLEEATQKAR